MKMKNLENKEKTLDSLKKILNYNSEDTFAKFKSWICNSPESYHALDMERWHEYSLSLIKNGDDLNWNESAIGLFPKINSHFSDSQLIEKYKDNFFVQKNFYDFLQKK
jgi:hypothetical protein